MNLKLAPSILSADFAALGADCTRVLAAGADALHFDVMDGCFVPNISFGIPVLAALHKVLPDAQYDVHLMIQNPLQYVQAFADAGATWLTFHCEADSPVQETVAAIRAAGMLPGVSIKPNTPPEAVFSVLDQLSMVLVMSVEPGFGGQRFLPQAAQKIAVLRAEANRRGLKDLILEVDGGITAETAPLCTAAGADMLVAGSAVFGKADYAAALQAIRAACAQKGTC